MARSQTVPPLRDAGRYAIEPGSPVWERASDARALLGAGTALVLQVAHPTVAAGVREHSSFERDPWGRLLRTLDYVNLLVYGEPAVAARTARRVREMHQRIRGVAPDGTRYHALEPEAYAWVHASLGHVLVEVHQTLARPMRDDELEEFYAGWLAAGRLLGVRERDLPASWAGFGEYVDWIVDERLEGSDVVDTVMASLSAQSSAPPWLADAAWTVVRRPAMGTLRLTSAGLLPRRLRERLGIPWSIRDAIEFRLLSRATRSATPVMPPALRRYGPRYLRWRRDAIAGGDFAGAGLA